MYSSRAPAKRGFSLRGEEIEMDYLTKVLETMREENEISPLTKGRSSDLFYFKFLEFHYRGGVL
jgi:hypothetical protein